MRIKRIINGGRIDTHLEDRILAEHKARELCPDADEVHAGLMAHGDEIYVEIWQKGKASIYVYSVA